MGTQKRLGSNATDDEELGLFRRNNRRSSSSCGTMLLLSLIVIFASNRFLLRITTKSIRVLVFFFFGTGIGSVGCGGSSSAGGGKFRFDFFESHPRRFRDEQSDVEYCETQKGRKRQERSAPTELFFQDGKHELHAKIQRVIQFDAQSDRLRADFDGKRFADDAPSDRTETHLVSRNVQKYRRQYDQILSLLLL